MGLNNSQKSKIIRIAKEGGYKGDYVDLFQQAERENVFKEQENEIRKEDFKPSTKSLLVDKTPHTFKNIPTFTTSSHTIEPNPRSIVKFLMDERYKPVQKPMQETAQRPQQMDQGGFEKKYEEGGKSEISEKQYFANYLKEAEGTDAVMKRTKSLVLRPDGKTYYNALEDGVYYPYNDIKGKQTIGYGRHTNTILADYPKGISAKEANTFLLEDIDHNFNRAKRQFNNKYPNQWGNLSEREQYMVTNFTYNPGSIYPTFSGALLNKDTKVANDEYKIYSYTNKGKDNEVKLSLGRNELFYNAYLKDWMDKIDNPPIEKTPEYRDGGARLKQYHNGGIGPGHPHAGVLSPERVAELDAMDDVINVNTDFNTRSGGAYHEDGTYNESGVGGQDYMDNAGALRLYDQQYVETPEPVYENTDRIREIHEPSLLKKITNTLANPLATWGYSIRHQPIPWGRVGTDENAFDMATGIYNPFKWGEYLGHSYDDFSEGDWLGGFLNLAGASPVVPSTITGAKYLKNTPVKNLKNTPVKNLEKSSINWGAVNKAIPENTALMQEYAYIEKITKQRGTWMKNADGTPFEGTEAMFVQSKSKNFNLAYGPDGATSVYRGIPQNKRAYNTHNGVRYSEKGYLGEVPGRTALFGGDEFVAMGYTQGSTGKVHNLLMRNSSNSIKIEGLGNSWLDLNTIGMSKEVLKKNIDNLKKIVKKGEVPNKHSASSNAARLESYENFYNNYDKITSNQIYKDLVTHKTEYNLRMFGTRGPLRGGSANYSTDEVASFVESRNLDNATLKYIDDGMMGDVIINNQVPGNYFKSRTSNRGTFDLWDINPDKQEGGFK